MIYYRTRVSSSKLMEEYVDVKIVQKLLESKIPHKNISGLHNAIKTRLKTKEGLYELMTITNLDSEGLIRYLLVIYPGIFTMKFCRSLNVCHFDNNVPGDGMLVATSGMMKVVVEGIDGDSYTQTLSSGRLEKPVCSAYVGG